MNDQPLILKPIGRIRSPFRDVVGTPIQPSTAAGARGKVEIFPEYAEGLADLGGFERIWLIYWFDRTCKTQLKVVPFRDTNERGLFATRAPCRPNPIGISSVRLLKVDGLTLEIGEVDIIDGTPLLDIKPYVPAFDVFATARNGWLDDSAEGRNRADSRFGSESNDEDNKR